MRQLYTKRVKAQDCCLRRDAVMKVRVDVGVIRGQLNSSYRNDLGKSSLKWVQLWVLCGGG